MEQTKQTKRTAAIYIGPETEFDLQIILEFTAILRREGFDIFGSLHYVDLLAAIDAQPVIPLSLDDGETRSFDVFVTDVLDSDLDLDFIASCVQHSVFCVGMTEGFGTETGMIHKLLRYVCMRDSEGGDEIKGHAAQCIGAYCEALRDIMTTDMAVATALRPFFMEVAHRAEVFGRVCEEIDVDPSFRDYMLSPDEHKGSPFLSAWHAKLGEATYCE